MDLLLKLLIAHFLGDFVLQPKSWVDDKQKRKIKSPKLYLHILIHLLVIVLLTFHHEHFIVILLLSIISHYLIDLLKLYLREKLN